MPIVGIAERLAGIGSRQKVITGTGKIVKFYSNFTKDASFNPSSFDPNYATGDEYYESRSAIVENLIIDGSQDPTGTTGLYLENVCTAFIRNITIKNCNIGIHLHNAKGAWTETNHLQHIQMENVKTGILFSTDGDNKPNNGGVDLPGDSFGHSYIDDVSINLRNTSGAVGIQIGAASDPSGVLVKPYFSFIRANIWLNSQDSCGVKLVNRGELRLGLANIGVHGNGTGTALDLTESTASILNPPIKDSQCAIPSSNIDGFLLRTQNVATNIKNNFIPYGVSDITVVSL
jgi:hypothetical protein